MPDIYIVQVCPAPGWGEDFFYCYHSLDNARAKIAELAEEYNMELLNSDFAVRWDDYYDVHHRIEEVKLSEATFRD